MGGMWWGHFCGRGGARLPPPTHRGYVTWATSHMPLPPGFTLYHAPQGKTSEPHQWLLRGSYLRELWCRLVCRWLHRSSAAPSRGFWIHTRLTLENLHQETTTWSGRYAKVVMDGARQPGMQRTAYRAGEQGHRMPSQKGTGKMRR